MENPLLSLALVLLAGIVGGEVLGRFKLPKVTGWIGTGIVLRAVEVPGLNPAELSGFAPFTNFVLGFIAFTVGATLHFASLRNAGRRLVLLLLGEAVLTPLVVIGGLVVLGSVERGPAMLLGAIAIAGAPGTTVLVVREARARGILTRTLIAAVGLIDMVAVGAFVVATTSFHDQPGGISILSAVGNELGVALAVGGGVAVLVLVLTRTLVGPAFVGPIMVAVILGAWGVGVAVGVSGILACTFAGIVVSNLKHETANAAEAYLHPFGGLLFAGFYTLAGMRLDFTLVMPVAGLVALFFVCRLLGKSLAAFLSMRLAGVTQNVQRYLGLALLPHGGVAVGLIFVVQGDARFAEVRDLVVSVGLAALAINQLLGPSATRFALTRAGEAERDRPRLLEFLKEQRIVVNLTGNTKRSVIETLATRLYATSPLEISKEAFIANVLERENEESTCLGEGFMIPHAVLSEGEKVTGVLGLSSQGMDLGAHDGRKIHAVVLLATPQTDRTRHLEVLSAFATAITRNANFREQLYHARSAAHAYEVLHADEADEINYFLDDAIQQAGVSEPEPTT